MKRLAAILAWAGITAITLLIAISVYGQIASIPQKSFRPQVAQVGPDSVTSNAVLPEVLGAFTYSVKSEDAIPEIIKKYLRKYDSPLLPYADYLVTASRLHGLDPRLMVAIAQQESNLCKKAPDNTHNCWGWGIHSRGTLGFPSYKEAIDTVTEGLSKNYLGQGLVTPEEIMAIYTPLSNGSWANGVQQFLDAMN